MPPATSFLRRRVLDGLPVDRLNGLWTRSFNEYYKKNIATSSIRPLLHIIALYSVTGYTMSHAVKHRQNSTTQQSTEHTALPNPPARARSIEAAASMPCTRG